MDNERPLFHSGDPVWQRIGQFYRRTTITSIDGEKALLGEKEASIDSLLPEATFAVSDEIRGIAFEASIYDYLVFKTYTTDRLLEMGKRGDPEGLYVEKSDCDCYRRKHFPGHDSTRPAILRLLANLEE